MAASDLTDRARRAADAYRSRDAELIARAREAAALQAPSEETLALQAALGLDDTEAIAALRAAGLTASTVGLLEWLPAIEVAWIDKVEKAEREVLRTQFAASPTADRAGLALLTEWLFVRPPHEAMFAARRALRHHLASMEANARRDAVNQIVSRCESVGRASGGLFGMGTLSWGERARIDGIREHLVDEPVPDPLPVEIPH